MMAEVIDWPEKVRLTVALLLLLALPCGFIGLCALALRPPQATARFTPLLRLLVVGLTVGLLVFLALRQSPVVLIWCLVVAAVFTLVPLMLHWLAWRGKSPQSPMPVPPIFLPAIGALVPLFFLWANFLEEILHISFPAVKPLLRYFFS
ncbi:hypothetical protein [Hymenobacter psoromatis]|uniref:hypothetical protein n=1 Tax=Hymenobacter psoromatis TaxID=1484116 RepID=UPI001CBBE910|nr:hypothetical protein [Hymenobacter psoromatis]